MYDRTLCKNNGFLQCQPVIDSIYRLSWWTDNDYVGTKAIAAGWGTLQEDGKPSCLLQEVEVPVMSLSDCRNMSYNPRMISDNMLCAGYREGKMDSCQVTSHQLLFLFSFHPPRSFDYIHIY